MGHDMDGRKIKHGTKTASKDAVRGFPSAAFNKYDILYADAPSGAFLSVKRAGSDVAASTGGKLYLAASPGTVGSGIPMFLDGVIEGVNTSAGAQGDPVYLSTLGTWSLTPSGSIRKIGTVLKVGTTDGEINFSGNFAGPASTPKMGTAAVAGTTSVTVTAATLGGTYGGRPVIATTNAGTTISVLTAVWSTNDLVITFSAAFTGTVSFLIGVN